MSKSKVFGFKFLKCVKSGGGYTKGMLYPILGWNNGINLGYEEESRYGGDAGFELMHNYDTIAPADCDWSAEYPEFDTVRWWEIVIYAITIHCKQRRY